MSFCENRCENLFYIVKKTYLCIQLVIPIKFTSELRDKLLDNFECYKSSLYFIKHLSQPCKPLLSRMKMQLYFAFWTIVES